MRGIDAARKWYETAGTPMLEREFGGVASRIAVGRAGHGGGGQEHPLGQAAEDAQLAQLVFVVRGEDQAVHGRKG